jgi:hypothetical protein
MHKKGRRGALTVTFFGHQGCRAISFFLCLLGEATSNKQQQQPSLEMAHSEQGK